MNELQDVLEKLIRFQSVTPTDAGCQEYMIGYLEELGFNCQKLDSHPVSNFFASFGRKDSGPLLVFAGHTDVVPVGDLEKWATDPFVLTEKEGNLYGRGVADMKGSLACMLVMAKRFLHQYPNFHGQLGFLITSGEEGDDYDFGTPYVMKHLYDQGLHIDYCVVGEPSSTEKVGDVIRVGRRGSLNAVIKLQGKQGHVAYPQLAKNPIHGISPFLAEFTSIEWDKGNNYFPPTSMQITYIHCGGYANNIIPGELIMHLNFRYSTEQTDSSLKERLNALFKKHDLHPTIEWRLSGAPFLTDKGKLIEECQQAILATTGITTELSTSGGTSDGRFIAPYGVEVVELGPVNATIHQINEYVAQQELKDLEAIYFTICERLLGVK